MSILSRLATARTFLANFAGPCLWIAVTGAVIGGGIGAYASHKVTRAFYRGEALEARNETLALKNSLATERAETLRLAKELSDATLERRNDEIDRLDSLADSVHELGQRVRLCASKSDVRVTVTPQGTIEAVPNGQLRDLAESVREFAESCARARDRDGADHNALVEWLKGMAKTPP